MSSSTICSSLFDGVFILTTSIIPVGYHDGRRATTSSINVEKSITTLHAVVNQPNYVRALHAHELMNPPLVGHLTIVSNWMNLAFLRL